MTLFLPLISKSIEALECYLYNKGRKAFLTVYDSVSFTETPFTRFTVPERTGKPQEFALIIKERYHHGKDKPGPDKVLYTQGSTDLFRNISSNNTNFFTILNDDVSGMILKNSKGECFTGEDGSTKIVWRACESGSANQVWKVVEDHKIIYMWEKMLKIDEDMKAALEETKKNKDKVKVDKKDKKNRQESNSSNSSISSSDRKHKKHKKKKNKNKEHEGIVDILDQLIPPNVYMPKHKDKKNSEDSKDPESEREYKIEKLKELFPGLNGSRNQICDKMWKVMCEKFSCCK